MREWPSTLLTLALAALGCRSSSVSEPAATDLMCQTQASCVEFASFESGLDGWTSRAADAGPWSITRVSDRARDGHSSLLIAASNSTDATKLWLQRTVRVQPSTTYSVRVEFALCCVSYEASALNPFQYIADASATSPRDSLPPFTFFPVRTPDDSSAAGPEALPEARWRHKRFDLVARSGVDGRLYVSAGLVHGFEISFQYWFDSVRLTISPQP